MRSKLISPLFTMSLGMGYLIIMGIVLYSLNTYSNSSFWSWSVPVYFFGKKIEDNFTFFILHVILFLHQIVNNHINTVVYPWIINSIQNVKDTDMIYSKRISLIIINMFNIYSNADMILIMAGFTSQISFVVTISISNILVSTYINSKYIDKKNDNMLNLILI